MSPTPIIGQDAAVDYAASHRNLGLRLFGAPPLRPRPAANVKRSYSISVHLELTPNAPKVMEVSPVALADVSTLRTCLRGEACVDYFNWNTFLYCLALKGEPQEAVRNSVDELPTSLSPLVSALSQMLKVLDDYSSIELFCQSDQLARKLPASGSCVVPLPSAERLEFLPSPTSDPGVPMGLKFCPPPLELRLHPRHVLPKIKLLQNSTLGAEDGHSNATSVDVHPKHVWAWSLYRCSLPQSGEELEVLTHDDGTDLPASSEVSLESSPSPVLGDWQPYSFIVDTHAQGWVAPLGLLDTEKAFIETNNHTVNPICSFTDSPGVASGFTHKLGSNAKSLSMLAIGQVMQFNAAPDLAGLDKREALSNHLEKRPVGTEELRPLDLGQRKCVQDETFLHGYQVRFSWYSSSDFRGERWPKVIYKAYKPRFLPHLKQEGLLGAG